MDGSRFSVNGGYPVERITTTVSYQFLQERRGPRQWLHTAIVVSNSLTRTNGPTSISVETLPSSSATYHTLFVFLIPLLVGVIEINNVQDEKKKLIKTHWMSMCLFLLALLIYTFAYFAAAKLKYQISNTIAIISGSLCSISLVSIILPHPYGHFSFIMWAFILLLIAYNTRLHKKIWQFWNSGGNNQQLLPI